MPQRHETDGVVLLGSKISPLQRSNGEETSSHRLSSSAGKEFGLIHKIISLINTQTVPRSTRELCLGKPQLAGYLSFQWGAQQAARRFTTPFFVSSDALHGSSSSLGFQPASHLAQVAP